MLRLAVLVLLLANAAYYAWSQGWLLDWGFGPAQQSEPQRMAQQIMPQAVRVLKTEETRRVEAAVSAARPAECLLAGPLEEAQVTALKSALAAWPDGSWAIEPVAEPARWIVYMGKYASADLASRKRAELKQLDVAVEPITNPALEPGLSLGGQPTEALARQQLQALTQRGVRTARVVLERAEVKGLMLVLPGVDDALRARLDELKPALGAKGAMRACP